MISIKFFAICKESMINVENREIQMWHEGGDTVPVKRNSHYLVPLPSSQTGPELTSEDESYVNIHSISLCDQCIQLVLVDWHG